MATLWQDLRFGVRTLLRNPLPTGMALLVLTLGIGANTAIFSVISGVLLEPLPYPSPEWLILAIDSSPRRGFPLFAVSPPRAASGSARSGRSGRRAWRWPPSAVPAMPPARTEVP